MKEEISLGELILEVLKFLKKYRILIASCFLLGGVIGALKESQSPLTYKSSMVLCSDLIKHNRLEEFILDLSLAASQNNKEFLSEKLNLSIDEASQIVKVEIEEYNKSASYGTRAKVLENQFEECVTIQLTVLDKSIFQNVENGISNSINSNKIVNKILESKRKNVERSRKMVMEDVEFLREQRKEFIRSLGDRKNVSDVDQFVTESNLIYAYDKITEYTELLDRMVPSYVMKSFSDVAASSKSLVKKGIIFGILFSFLGMGIGVFREIKLD